MRKLCLSIALIILTHPAFAFDCALATSTADKTICSDPEARGADEALGKAYTTLRHSFSESERAELRQSQIKWISARDASCAAPRGIKPLSKCLVEQSKERQRFLEGRPHEGDSSVRLFSPTFIFQPAKNGYVRLSIEAIKFTGSDAWQSTINTKIDSWIKNAILDAEGEMRQPGSNEDFNVELNVDLSYASSRMVSVHAVYESYLGQPHPLYWTANINFDRSLNREMKFDNLLDGAAAKQVFEFCRSQVAKEKIVQARDNGDDNQKDDVELEDVAADTKDLSRWQFESSAADIDYGSYAFGGYGHCMCNCTIPYSTLRPIAKKDFPLP